MAWSEPGLSPHSPALSPGERTAAVEAVIGVPVEGQARFNKVLVDQVEESWQRDVVPVLRKAWPQMLQLPYLKKLRAGFETYTSLGLSIVVCSRTRPGWLRAASVLAGQALMSEETMARWGVRLLPWAFRTLLRAEVRRVALMGALILVLDEALDDGLMELPPGERPDALWAVVQGQRAVGQDVLGAADGLCRAVRAECRDGEDRARLAVVFEATRRWAREETDNLLGVPDPLGFCHRRIGITTSMDMVAWGVGDVVGDVERAFLYDVAELGQMVDDWLDCEKDGRAGRVTPAILGKWTLQGIGESFARTQAMLKQMTEAGGETYPPYVELVRRTYVTQIQRMVQILAHHP